MNESTKTVFIREQDLYFLWPKKASPRPWDQKRVRYTLLWPKKPRSSPWDQKSYRFHPLVTKQQNRPSPLGLEKSPLLTVETIKSVHLSPLGP